jgi:heat shock protein HtpX
MAESTRIRRGASLTIRMVLVSVLTPLMAVALAVAVAVMLPSRYLPTLVLMLMASFGVWFFRRGNRNHDAERLLTEADDPELFAVVDRLYAMADIPRRGWCSVTSASPTAGSCTSPITRRACT